MAREHFFKPESMVTLMRFLIVLNLTCLNKSSTNNKLCCLFILACNTFFDFFFEYLDINKINIDKLIYERVFLASCDIKLKFSYLTFLLAEIKR